MRTSSVRAACQLALLLIIALASITLPAVRAQESTPPAPSEPTTQAERAAYNGEIVTDPEKLPTAPATAAAAATGATDANMPDASAAPDAAAKPAAPAKPDLSLPRPQLIQGVITLLLSIDPSPVREPNALRAGDYINYTYSYTNNSGQTASDIVIDATWSNFSPSNPGNDVNIWQFCDPTPCAATNVQGPAVTAATPPSDVNARFTVGSLANGQSGKFTVRLRSNPYAYPRTGQQIARPAGSGRLYTSVAGGKGPSTPTSDDTKNVLIVGPVFVLTKTPLTTTTIYPTETASFRINIGNATGSGDQPSGAAREDARPATTIKIVDTFPAGSDFVSATGNPVVDTTAKTVTWTLAGPLAPGQSSSVDVTFRRLDIDVGDGECRRVRNEGLTVTSNEMPLIGAAPLLVNRIDSAEVPVQIPMDFKSITSTPPSAPFGTEATITVVVRNYWPQAVTGAKLNYDIQTNGYYVVNSATPAPTSAPAGTATAGRVTWTFDMPAGSKTSPTERTFSLRVRGAFTDSAQSGIFQILAPSGMPGACIRAQEGRATFVPRLTVVKYAGVDGSTALDGIYIVSQGQEFPYIIEVTNAGVSEATGINILDFIPSESGANFSYVVGSSTINGVTRAPNSFVDGQGGSIRWNGLTIPAKSTLTIRYRLKVDGRDYNRYCNTVSVSNAPEPISFTYRNVCVKINPKINITKVTDPTKTTATPGEEVRFRLTLTNNEATVYRVGLYDYLGNFQFVRQESGYAQPQVNGTFGAGRGLLWPAINLNPGQQIEAVIVARVPDVCETRDYSNEGMFHNDIDVIRLVPPALATVHVTCGKIDYFTYADRQVISLKDRVAYTLEMRNNDGAAALNTVAEALLPQGFSYVGLDGGSDMSTPPTQSTLGDGRVKLVWTVPSISAGATYRIKFIARSGDIVGQFKNWFTITPTARCSDQCEQDGAGVTYATRTVTVQPLITMEPQINPTSCVQPGAKPVYRLTIVNANNHDYTSTAVNVTLPFGLRFLRTLNSTATPKVTTTDLGVTTVSWTSMRIPAKPDNQVAAQVVLEIELEVGQVWGDLATQVNTTSPDGTIPRKEGVVNPTILVCPASPSIAKDASKRVVRVGEEFVYQITLANTTASAVNVTVQDRIPSNFSFVANTIGTASVSGNTLTWVNVSVPAASGGKAGITVLQFRVRVNSGAPGGIYPNTATILSSPITFNTTYSTINVRFPSVGFLPLGVKG
jgi:uncharacterized repeat protein (TIGR01451 family)